MKITDSDKAKHRNLQNEGDLQKLRLLLKNYAFFSGTLYVKIN